MPPVTKKAPTATPAPKPSKTLGTAAKLSGGRPVKHPKYEVKICCLPVDGVEYDGPLTYEMMKKLLGWETESEYTARVMAADPKVKESKAKFGDDFLLKNYAGEKVRCWNNVKNRPFDENRAKAYGQDILEKNWEMNCENMIIGQTGIVISAQHRGCGFMLAVEEWRATKLKGGGGHWEKNWPEEPVLETMLALGCREDPRVIRTIDNVKTRTLSDTIYTSPMFEKLDSVERKECSRMMDFAVDLLWKRTKQANEWSKYQTHSSSLDFLDKHAKIKACVKHIFDNNRDRVISLLGLSPGQAAGMMYLMGCSNTDPEDYHFSGSAKKESQLDWSNWDKALEFWSALVDSKNEYMDPIRSMFANLRAKLAKQLNGDAPPEKLKHMVLSRAWDAFLNKDTIDEDDVEIGSLIGWNSDKQRAYIIEEPTLGGIDCGSVKDNGEQAEVIPSAEDLEQAKEKEKQAGLQKMKDVVAKPKTTKEVIDEEEEAVNPLIEQKVAAATKGKPVFSEEERAKLVAQVKGGVRGANNEPAPKPRAPKKPTLK